MHRFRQCDKNMFWKWLLILALFITCLSFYAASIWFVYPRGCYLKERPCTMMFIFDSLYSKLFDGVFIKIKTRASKVSMFMHATCNEKKHVKFAVLVYNMYISNSYWTFVLFFEILTPSWKIKRLEIIQTLKIY